jgi:proton-dependent oligopeptide transporter, POT family
MTTIPDDKALDKALARVATLDEKASFHSGPSEDDIVPGSEGVTHRELATLRHVRDSLPYSAWLVVTVEFAERWTYYGTTNLYSNYIRAPRPDGSRTGAVPKAVRDTGVAGALGLGQEKAFALRE